MYQWNWQKGKKGDYCTSVTGTLNCISMKEMVTSEFKEPYVEIFITVASIILHVLFKICSFWIASRDWQIFQHNMVHYKLNPASPHSTQLQRRAALSFVNASHPLLTEFQLLYSGWKLLVQKCRTTQFKCRFLSSCITEQIIALLSLTMLCAFSII